MIEKPAGLLPRAVVVYGLWESGEVEEVFEAAVEGGAEDEGELGGGAELAGLDGADGVAGDADEFGELALGEALLCTDVLQVVFQYKGVVHGRLRLWSG